MNATRPREVPLEAGLGPDNPPCPACGEPLFGWETLPGAGTPVRRCERCGLGVAGGPAGRDDALAAAGEATLPNRASFQARLGASGWAGLEPGRRFLFTADSLRRLGVPAGRSRPHLAGAWQTILNSFTFGHNVALGRLGRATAVPADRRWQRLTDGVVSVLASPIVLVGAALLEGVATLCGAGGRLPVVAQAGLASSRRAEASSPAPPT